MLQTYKIIAKSLSFCGIYRKSGFILKTLAGNDARVANSNWWCRNLFSNLNVLKITCQV